VTVRLNLGSGDDHRDGYISVDLREEVADVVCDIRKLEHWADGEVDEILANDVLEHFGADQTRAILAEWHRVLRPGGTLRVRVPNLYMICQLVVSRTDSEWWGSVRLLTENLYGGHKYGPEGSLDAHHTGWVPALLHQALIEAGFEIEWDDGALNFTVGARRV
jgi:SAM-dependent methyltransferase